MSIKSIIYELSPKLVKDFRSRILATRPRHPRMCPICGFQGSFTHFGRPPRIDARCPNCLSLERHRLFWLWFKGEKQKMAEPVLHFAPERMLESKFRELYEEYQTADLFTSADIKLNIEQIELPAGSVKTVLCNHVLEHVSDSKALAEIYRILSEDGVLIVSVPIVEGWERTYEKADVKGARAQEIHFGQRDHVRYYGRDFRDRLRAAGFKEIREVTAEGQDVIEYGLLRGEKFFICSKL